MIKEIVVWGYDVLRMAVERDPNLIQDPNNFFISINCPDWKNTIFDGPHISQALKLTFWDLNGVDERSPEDLKQWANDRGFGDGLFTKEMASLINQELNKFIKAPGEYTLYTNCYMGISRSGAVAKHAQAMCGAPITYKGLGTGINPNRLMMQLLMEDLMNA